jgi:hypothetical protein
MTISRPIICLSCWNSMHRRTKKNSGNPTKFHRPSTANRDRYGLDLARAAIRRKSGIFHLIRASIANPQGPKNLSSPQFLPLFPERSNRGRKIMRAAGKPKRLGPRFRSEENVGWGNRKRWKKRASVPWWRDPSWGDERAQWSNPAVVGDHAAANRLKQRVEKATARHREKATQAVSPGACTTVFLGFNWISGPIRRTEAWLKQKRAHAMQECLKKISACCHSVLTLCIWI